jgi:hypothetical protein
MNHRVLVRTFVYCLTVLMLVANVTGVAASSVENVKQAGNVITVTPTGSDDTANIEQAFKLAKAAGPGSTVRLGEGKFTIRFIEVNDFDGYFKGAGQGKTVIDTFGGLECQAQVDNDKWPSLLRFVRGYPRLSELSFRITPAAPCKPYSVEYFQDNNKPHTYFTVLMIAASSWNPKTDCAVIQKEKVSASLTNVTFEGGTSETDLSNIMSGITMGGAITTHLPGTNCAYTSKYGQGAFRMTHTTFRKVGSGIDPYGMYNSSVVLSDNFLDTIAEFGILASDLSGSMLDISHNRMKNVSGRAIFIFQGGAPVKPFIQAAAVFNIHDNEISVFGEGSGIVAWDFDNLGTPFAGYPSTGNRTVLVVRDNRFTLTPDSVRGIWMEGVDGALILNNTFSGKSGPAIIAGEWGLSRRGMIKGNDLRGYTLADGSPYKIVLEAGTEKYMVMGVPAEAVADHGTNNMIVGKAQTKN